METEITLLTAFTAGVISFLSPCVLPLIPAYISFISGTSLEEVKSGGAGIWIRVILSSAVFILGFSLVFTLLGASATLIGRFLLSKISLFTKIGGAIVVLLGLHTTGLFRIRFLDYERRLRLRGNPMGLVGAFGVGVAFAFGWSPCIGPILATILMLASTQETVLKGSCLLAIYSLGLGIPFMLTGAATGAFLKTLGKIKAHLRSLEIISGVFLIIVGTLIFSGSFSRLTEYLLKLFQGG